MKMRVFGCLRLGAGRGGLLLASDMFLSGRNDLPAAPQLTPHHSNGASTFSV
jgi:hypothetical protein